MMHYQCEDCGAISAFGRVTSGAALFIADLQGPRSDGSRALLSRAHAQVILLLFSDRLGSTGARKIFIPLGWLRSSTPCHVAAATEIDRRLVHARVFAAHAAPNLRNEMPISFEFIGSAAVLNFLLPSCETLTETEGDGMAPLR
jgi:hypothetical protein